MEYWSDGVNLLGVYGESRTGCWILYNDGRAAILELPPYNPGQWSPTIAAQIAAEQRNLTIEYLLCSHAHTDHIAEETLKEFNRAFPGAQVWLQNEFQEHMPAAKHVHYFDDFLKLSLGGEPLYLVHAPKHSWTDTIVIFKGVAITGDWELNTIRSVHDGNHDMRVPLEVKLESIEKMKRFPVEQKYLVHKVFSVHANDRRDEVDFEELMEDTKEDRVFW